MQKQSYKHTTNVYATFGRSLTMITDNSKEFQQFYGILPLLDPPKAKYFECQSFAILHLAEICTKYNSSASDIFLNK